MIEYSLDKSWKYIFAFTIRINKKFIIGFMINPENKDSWYLFGIRLHTCKDCIGMISLKICGMVFSLDFKKQKDDTKI